jgi:sulfide dehydrogenase [flavocytochrome c] flavoprotein subunit
LFSNRRDLLLLPLSGVTGLLATLPFPAANAQVQARLVIIGGGFGGATAARFLKRLLAGSRIVDTH